MKSNWESHSSESNHLEKAVLSILSKLSTIVSQRFDVDTRFVDLNSTDSLTQSVQLALQDSLIYSPKKLTNYFALKSQGRLVGALETQGALPTSDQKQVIEIVELLGSSTLSTVNQLTNLSSLEQNLKLIDPEKNVIRMARKSAKETHRHEAKEAPSLPQQNPDDLCTIIVSKSRGDRFRDACQLHYDSSRYAFLKISDLQGFAFQSLEKFKTIGGATIFVEDTASLGTDMQLFLTSYLSSFPGPDCPFIVFGIGDIEELELAKSRVHPDLLPHLQWASITNRAIPNFQESPLHH